MLKLFPIEKDLTKVNHGPKGANHPQWIVIHFVGASGQAKDNANYFRHFYRAASAHYFVDPHHIIQVVEDDTPAWHIGDGYSSRKGQLNGYKGYGATNNNSIGIEGCQDTSTGKNVWHWDFHPITYQQMLLFTRKLQKKYQIPDSRVIRHFDASGKICPGNWQWNNWEKWYQFKRDLAKIDLNIEDVTLTSKVKDHDGKQTLSNTYTIKVGDTLGKIAKSYKVKVADLVKWNQIKNPNLIFPETQIFIQDPSIISNSKKEIKQNNKTVPLSGTFRFNTVVNVRNQAGAYGDVLNQYHPGQTVRYDDVVEAGGLIWLKYRAYNGEVHYVSAGTPSIAYGTFE